MQDLSKKLSERIYAMSFLSACMIVFFHASPAPEAGSFNWWFFHILGREGVCSIAVPYFFVCSGFFLAGHFGEHGWWKREVLKRVKSLMVPYYIWMAICILFGLSVAYMKNRCFHMEVDSKFLTMGHWEQVIFYLGLHPFKDIGVLWYVRALFLIVLASPAIFVLLRWPVCSCAVLGLAHLTVGYLFCGVLGGDMYFLFDRMVSIRGLAYFFAGAALRRADIDLVGVVDKSKKGLFWCAGILLLMGANLLLLRNLRGLSEIMAMLAVPFLMVGMWAIIPEWGRIRSLTQYSFPIFLMHPIFLSLISMAFMAIGLRDNVFAQIPIAFVRTVGAVAGPILTASLIKRRWPKLGCILFGGR